MAGAFGLSQAANYPRASVVLRFVLRFDPPWSYSEGTLVAPYTESGMELRGSSVGPTSYVRALGLVRQKPP